MEGPAFLAALPTLIREYEARWRVRALAPFPLSFNYVAPAVREDGAEVVLKLGVPNPEFVTEIAALRLYDGRSAARVLEAEPERGAALLERVRPGEPLALMDDDDVATLIAAEVMERLWRPLPEQRPLPAEHPFPDFRRWTRSLREFVAQRRGEPGPLLAAHVDRANGILDELLAAPEEPVLIHGDFHGWNVLSAQRESWLAIDPKGVAAERAFDTAPIFYNPAPAIFARPDLARITARRLVLLSERLELDRQRVLLCAYVGVVLSACWSVEGGEAEPGTVLVADALAQLMR